jgi:hypothetical protein
VLVYLIHWCSSVVCSQFVLDLFPVLGQDVGLAANGIWFGTRCSTAVLQRARTGLARRDEEDTGRVKFNTMPKQCLFCGNAANSKEHLWPRWILERLGKRRDPTRRKIGKAPAKTVPHSEVEIRCVCIPCNGGWMKGLEIENSSLIGEMMKDVSMSLNPTQQTSLANWAMKTSMVLDDVETESRDGHFYSREEAEGLRLHRTIPIPTNVWIGRYSKSDLTANGTVVSLDVPNRPKAAKASISTILVGHFVVQTVTIHNDPKQGILVSAIDVAVGDWDSLLVQIWPHGSEAVSWPPPETFTQTGQHSIGTLLDRWRLGKPV